jgi:hypothetical protein
LLVLIVIVGPTFAAFIFLLALIFTSRQVALLPLTFFSLLLPFFIFLQVLFVKLISNLRQRQLAFVLKLAFIIKLRRVSQLALLQ